MAFLVDAKLFGEMSLEHKISDKASTPGEFLLSRPSKNHPHFLLY